MTTSRFNFRAYIKAINKLVDVEILHPEYIQDYKGNLYITYELIQSTGMVDKNRKEIFEEDIIEISTYKAVIKWEDCGFKIKSSCCDLALDIIRAEQCEVLGNIYENKELLGE